MSRINVKFLVLQVGGVLLFACLAVMCFRWSLADTLATQIRYHLDNIRDTQPTPLNVKRWQDTQRRLDRLLVLRRQDPQYLELAERYHQMLDTLNSDAPELVAQLGMDHDHERQALLFAREALLLRPSWPYLWEERLLSKLTLAEYDSELDISYERATQLGRWDATLQYDLAILGLEHWPKLPEASKTQVVQAMNQVLIIDRPKDIGRRVLDAHENKQAFCSFYQQTMQSMNYHALKEVCQ